VGSYLQKIKAQDHKSCPNCHALSDTVEHQLLECRQWREERRTLQKDLLKARVQFPTAAEDSPAGRLFGDQRATKALLKFISATGIGCRRDEERQNAERVQKDNNWRIEMLEEEERVGEG
jgi:hypothetical protein